MQPIDPWGVTPDHSATSHARRGPSNSPVLPRTSSLRVRTVPTPTNTRSSGQPPSGTCASPLRPFLTAPPSTILSTGHRPRRVRGDEEASSCGPSRRRRVPSRGHRTRLRSGGWRLRTPVTGLHSARPLQLSFKRTSPTPTVSVVSVARPGAASPRPAPHSAGTETGCSSSGSPSRASVIPPITTTAPSAWSQVGCSPSQAQATASATTGTTFE